MFYNRKNTLALSVHLYRRTKNVTDWYPKFRLVPTLNCSTYLFFFLVYPEQDGRYSQLDCGCYCHILYRATVGDSHLTGYIPGDGRSAKRQNSEFVFWSILTHCILVDSSNVICWASPFFILGGSQVYFVAFILFLI